MPATGAGRPGSIATGTDELPRHGSLVVPYVTLRSSEEPPAFVTELQAPDGQRALNDQDRELWALDPAHLCRDAYGCLWPDYPEDMSGPPLWKESHPTRHRRCTDELRCQVCGEKTAEPTTWLVEVEVVIDDGRLLAFSPPVCQACIPISEAQCPELVRGTVGRVEARRVHPYAVTGDVYAEPAQLPDGRYVAALEAEDVTVPLDDPRVQRTVAVQRVMALEQWRRLDTGK